MLGVGFVFTVKTTSFVVKASEQAFPPTTVRRRVAVAGAPLTVTVVLRSPGLEIVTRLFEATTVQLVDTSAVLPGVAFPCIVNVVVDPWLHKAWSSPALADGPMTSG